MKRIARALRATDRFFTANAALILTLALLLAMPAFYIEDFEISLAVPLGAAAQSFSIATLLALICYEVRRKWFTRTVVALTALLFFVDVWLNYNFFSRPTGMMLALAGQTTPEETWEFIAHYLPTFATFQIACVTALTLLSYPLLIKLFTRLKLKASAWRGAAWLALTAMSVASCVYFYRTEIGHPHAKTTVQMWEYALRERSVDRLRLVENLIDASQFAAVDSCSFDAPVIVWIIGESHSKLHTSLYGYRLPTMPGMESLRKEGSLIVFDSITARHTLTYQVLNEMYSTSVDAADDTEWSHSPLVFTLFREAGYDVMLFDNQCTQHVMPAAWDVSSNYYLSNPILHELNLTYRNNKLYKLDSDMIAESFGKIPADRPLLVVYHLNGQHLEAKKRYDSSHTTFTMADYSDRTDLSKRQKEEVMHYDNATAELDSNLMNIINKFKDTDAVVVYCSDHGEEIHDYRDYYGRSTDLDNPMTRKCLLEVPMMVWCSDSFAANHPENVARLKNATARRWTNSYMAQFLLELAGIRSRYNQPAYSLIVSPVNPTK